MSIKKLQRYDYDTAYNGNTGQYQVIFFKEDEGFYCADKDVTELEATNAELVKALEETLRFLEDMHTEPTNVTIQRSVEFKAEICGILAKAKG